ncbi:MULTISPECIES: tripartite tricarboxylate transporter TctB family protein [unclassified Brenneria]|uniref:tripartite tricarboxylate transporter TctB family protein n=1 Tax=unclassified Brenneria TaxID=2634434 RepID=UPI0015554815|nr:tripartite tricarboxylate transporter TctB family protein [Brenneria sp. hezel4-2-4]MEE3652462.1 tripartite tricarboxylate transporter TctB family protein [Brenneria sp. HEZEL_4_2_4]NPD02419.1 tripartite tricarboxylate transporter TctB family protein [Brenneria sp. hezel4-2-4]
MPKLSLLLPLLFLLFGAGIAAYAFIQLGDAASFGAGFMPAIVGCLMVLLSVLDLITVRLTKAHRQPANSGQRDLISVGMVAITVVFYIYCVEFLGFILTTSIIMAGLLVLFLPKNKAIAAVAAVGLSTGIYYLFSKVLLVPLPSGSIF